MNLRKWGICFAGAVVAGLLAPCAPASPPSPASTSLVKSGELARDCVGQARLDGNHARVIRFIAWCSIQSGEVRFSLRRANEVGSRADAPITSFSMRPETSGPGAGRGFHCRRRAETLSCSGKKSGPVVVRGEIEVPAGSRCAVPIWIRAAVAYFQGVPRGCPGTHRERANFDMGYMRSFRREMGLDEDLQGDQAAIDRRIHGLVRAWRRGDPVARVSADQYGQPFRAADQCRLEFRDELLERTASALERWVPRHAADTYAGYEIDDEHGAIFYVGFTGDQEVQLTAFKSQMRLFAPKHIQPFPVPPLYSERALLKLEEEAFEPPDSPLARLVNSLKILVLPNKIEVGTEHVTKVKRLLAERFGADAPFLVVFARGGTLL